MSIAWRAFTSLASGRGEQGSLKSSRRRWWHLSDHPCDFATASPYTPSLEAGTDRHPVDLFFHLWQPPFLALLSSQKSGPTAG